MVSIKKVVQNPQGLHMRPAQIFVAAMSKHPCDVSILFAGKKINGKSIMRVMGACIKKGSEIEIQCSGDGENNALEEAAMLIDSGFGEL